MASKALTFRQRDLTAAIKAAQRAGVRRFRVEAESGKVVVIVDNDDAKVAPADNAGGDEWEGAKAL